MKATLFIKDYVIENLSPEILYSDVMDGTSDTLSVSFKYDIDLTQELQLKTKAKILLEDNVHALFDVGYITDTHVYFGGNFGYTIDGDFIIDALHDQQKVGVIDKINKTISFDNKLYRYYEELSENRIPLYLDNRKEYNLCLTQISSSLNSTVADNGYFISMNFKEQTVLLKDCVRSDLAITPSLYPQEPTQDFSIDNLFKFEGDNFEVSGINVIVFEDAILIHGRNTGPIFALRIGINIPAGTHNYKNISTDVPFSFVNEDTGYEVSSLSYPAGSEGSITFEQNITHLYITISVGSEYDSDVINWEISSEGAVIVSKTAYKQIYPTLYEATCKVCDRHNMQLLNDKIYVIDDDLIDALKKVSCPNLTYKDLSTYDQLADIFMRIGRIPYFEENTLYGISLNGDTTEKSREFQNKFLKSSLERAKLEGINQNVYSTKVYNNVYDEELVTIPTIFTDGANQQYTQFARRYKNSTDTEETILKWYSDTLYDWTRLDARTEQDSKRLLGISNFNDLATEKEDVRNYGITLPSNIQYVHSIYKVRPYCRFNSLDNEYIFGFQKIPIGCQIWTNVIENNEEEYKMIVELKDSCRFTINGTVYEYSKFCDINGNGEIANISSGFPYEIIKIINYKFYINNKKYDFINNAKLIEYSYWKELSSLQQASTAYYTVGENEIKQAISLLIYNDDYLRGDFTWREDDLYNALKSWFYMIEYRPMNTQKYINYDYNYVSDGEENKPMDVNNYNIPYKTVTDVQIYPLLEYSLEKGLDKNTNLKFVTRDYSILDYSAGEIIVVDGEAYIINEAVFDINNKSVECSMTLSNKIVTQSILSSLSDNVRVSSNLSTESTVDVDLPILSEQVIYCDDKPMFRKLLDKSISYDNGYFTQDIGKFLSMNTYLDLGLIDSSTYDSQFKNIYNYMTKYPFRFSKLIEGNGESYAYRIRLNSSRPYGQNVSEKLEFKFNEFPIYIRRHSFDTSWNIGTPIRINSYYELISYHSSTIQLYVEYAKVFGKKLAVEYVWYDFSSDGEDWVQLRPEICEGENGGVNPNFSLDLYYGSYGWNEVVTKVFDGENYSNTYSPYEIIASYNGDTATYDTMSVYSTEGVLTQSGNITSYVYLINNPEFLNTRYDTTSIPDTIVRNMNDNPNSTFQITPTIPTTDPIYYNKSSSGCLLEGFGSAYADISNISILQKYSSFGYGYCMDLREIIKPNIQFKTVFRDSEKIKIKELSKNVNWMNTDFVSSQETSLNNVYWLLKVDKNIRLSDLIINPYNIIEYDTNNYVLNNFDGSFEFALGLTKDDDYDYVLVQTNSRNTYDLKYIRPIIKFNIADDKYVEKLVFHLDIRNSYSSIAHWVKGLYLNRYIDENISFTDSYTINLGQVDFDASVSKLIVGIRMDDSIHTRFNEVLELQQNQEYKKYSFEYMGNIKTLYYVENNTAYLKIDFSDLSTDEFYPNLPSSFMIWLDAIYKEV